MAIDIPIKDPVRLITTASTDAYEAPGAPSTVKVINLRFGLMHDGTSTNPVAVAIHVLSTSGSYGADTEVDRITVSPGKSEKTRSMQIGAGGKIVMAAGEADQITSNLENGTVFS